MLLRRRKNGFSLVELLTAMAVLSVVVFMIVQIMDGAAHSVSHGNKRMDSDTEARMLFNRLATDFSQMLKRRDLDYSAFKQPAGVLASPYQTAAGDPIDTPANPQPGNDRLAFFAEADGYFPAGANPSGQEKSPIALVAWQIQDDPETGFPGLARLARGLGWEPGASAAWGTVAHLPQTLAGQWPNLFANSTDFQSVGDQAFRIEYVYLLKSREGQPARLSITPWDSDPALDPPHTSVDGFRDVAAIVVTIAVLDRTSREIVADFSGLIGALPDAAEDGSGSVRCVAAIWNETVNGPNFSAQVGIPQLAGSSVRIYERHFPLDTSQ
jgi:prepilin-type N-terminal cleavage/methylation domain-containing protein